MLTDGDPPPTLNIIQASEIVGHTLSSTDKSFYEVINASLKRLWLTAVMGL